MAALTARLTVLDDPADGPEDILNSSLAAIYPDDVANTHGDAAHALQYTSPHLPRPLLLQLTDPQGEQHRRLFSHYLWNAALLLAELVESATLGVPLLGGGSADLAKAVTTISPQDTARMRKRDGADGDYLLRHFDVRNRKCIELGAGTALPSLMAALLGARHVTITDYPSAEFLETVRRNVAHNIVSAELSPPRTPEGTASGQAEDVGNVVANAGDDECRSPASSTATLVAENGWAAGDEQKHGMSASASVTVQIFGHKWGVLPGDDDDDDDATALNDAAEDNGEIHTDSISTSRKPQTKSAEPAQLTADHHHAYDRVLAADCLWMSEQHANLAASISYLLRRPKQSSTRKDHQTGNDDVVENQSGPEQPDTGGRALVVAGFHTGRQGMRGFLFSPPLGDPSSTTTATTQQVATGAPPGGLQQQQEQQLGLSAHLLTNSLEVESIYERDCDGNTRPWAWDCGFEDPSERKRWLVVAVLRPV